MHIMDELMEEQVQLVVVGTGDEEYADALRELAWRHPGSVSVNILFNEGLARRVYAGSDMFIMPSRYEACGLSQMIAMRYGTVPVVRETGGLKDSVINFDKYNTPEGNGFSFANFNAHELLFTIKRGLTCYAAKPLWEKIVYNAMHSDNSWNRSAQAYADLYAHIAGDTITVEPVSEDQVAEAAEEILQAVKGEEPAEETGNTAAAAAETAEAEKAVQAANEEVLAETAPEAEQVPAPETKAEAEKAPEKPEEPEAAAEPVKKKTAAKRTTKKAADKTTETKKTTAKKATAKKATTKKSAAATEEGAAVKKTTARKTTAKKKADTTADVTTEAAEAAAPKKRGRKPGTKNTKKDAE